MVYCILNSNLLNLYQIVWYFLVFLSGFQPFILVSAIMVLFNFSVLPQDCINCPGNCLYSIALQNAMQTGQNVYTIAKMYINVFVHGNHVVIDVVF